MVYVYDVLVNLNEELYDFYDWDEKDSFSHVRRTPLFKVSRMDLFNISSKKIRISEDIMSKIQEKTQIFSSRNIEVIPYASIVTDGDNALMVEFDSKGYSKRKSKFLVTEEMEIIEVAKGLKESGFIYNIINNRVKRNNMIRSEKKVLEDILSELEYIKDDKEKIDYLYCEWFDKQDGVNKYESLVSDLKKRYTFKHLDFLNLLNILTIKK